ncbi:MAG: response regulator [Candidatus Bathyarchaeia archaeon]|jgi:YesN/AraC family two-component response regulator
MNERTEKVLIIDDDKETLLALSRVLELDGYTPKTASNGSDAIVMAEKEHFDVFLIDIILPDMDGTQLLAQIQSINPRAVKIMITGYPSVENATESLNKGANAFFVKPINAETLLQDIQEKLKARDQKIAAERKDDWVKLRINKIQISEYSQFADETAELFGVFGLSRTQAKIYMAINALGVATASEISALSKIRREEVYRIMPELETRGLISSRLEAPRKFAATEAKLALNILFKMRIEELENEMLTLQKRKEELISRMLSSSFGIYEENSVEALSKQDNVEMRLSQMAKKAKNNILIVGSIDEMKKIINETTVEAGANPIKMRTIVGACEFKDETSDAAEWRAFRHFIVSACRSNCVVDLRQVAKRAFNLAIVDGKEAIWGESKTEKAERKVFWTNDPVQVGILKRAFEHLWQEALPCECQNELRTMTLV